MQLIIIILLGFGLMSSGISDHYQNQEIDKLKERILLLEGR